MSEAKLVEEGFFLARPGLRPEYWTAEEWKTAVCNADLARRREKVEREYELAKRTLRAEEFEEACAQRTARSVRDPDRRGQPQPVTDEEILAVSRWFERRFAQLRADA